MVDGQTRTRKSAAKVPAKGRATNAKPPARKTAASSTRKSAASKPPAKVDPAEGLPPHKYIDDGTGACERECGKGPRAAIHKRVDDPPPPPTPPAKPGPLETAYLSELRALHLDDTALGASALALARMADKASSDGSSGSAVELLREARMALGAARGFGPKPAAGTPTPTSDGEGGQVITETRLERLRREREERAAGHGRR